MNSETYRQIPYYGQSSFYYPYCYFNFPPVNYHQYDEARAFTPTTFPKAWRDSDVVLCPYDRPCIQAVYNQGNNLIIEWNDTEARTHYNFRWSRPGKPVKQVEVQGGRGGRFTLRNFQPNTRYTFAVQGCRKPLIGGSTCTPWYEFTMTSSRYPSISGNMMMAPNGKRFNDWLLNTADNRFNLMADFDGDGKTEMFVSSPWGIGILKLSDNTLTASMMASNGTRFGGWILNTADNRFRLVGDFDGDGKDEILVASPWGIGILKLSGNTLTASMMAPNGTRFGGWLLNTADNRFSLVGDVDGDKKDEILVTSPWGIGILKLSGNTLTASMMAPNGTRFGGWLLNTADNHVLTLADLDGDGKDEIVITSPWGIGVLKLSGNTLTASMMAPNGTRFGGWILNTADNRFGHVSDFDGDGKDEILVTSPWGIGILKLSGNTLTAPMMAPNGTRFGGWLLNTADNRFSLVGDVDGDKKDEILVTSPWGIGILKLSGNTLTASVMAPNGTRFGEWLVNTADNYVQTLADLDGDGKDEIVITSPWGIGVLKLSGNTLTSSMMAPNGTRFDG